MSRKKTLKEWQIQSNDIHNNEFEILEEPLNAHSKVKVKHNKCGNIINVTLANHTKTYCRYCSGKHKPNLKEWQERSDNIHNNEFDIIEIPSNGKSKVKIKHKKCDYIFDQSMNNHINHKNGCPKCSQRLRVSELSIEELQERSDNIHNGEYIILEKPKYIRDRVNILHKKCGNINNQTLSNHLSIDNNRGCKICYGNLSKSLKELQKRSDNIHNGEYEILLKPINYDDKVGILHKRCGNVNESTMRIHISHKCGCVICSESMGERKVRKYLMNNNIEFESEKKFDGCVNVNKLPFDFYLPSECICIEFDGIQHFEPVDYFGGTSSHESLIKRDNIKTQFCIDNNIKLIRVKYDEDVSLILYSHLHQFYI